MTLALGAEAPDFTRKDQDGNDVTLSSFRGKQNVVLIFYPFTFTGVCQGELCAVRDDLSQFQNANAQVLAISCDSRFAQQQWDGKIADVIESPNLDTPREKAAYEAALARL